MNMRKGVLHMHDRRLAPMAARVLYVGLVMIYASLLRLWLEVESAAPFTAARAAYFGGLLEYPVAALMLLTGAVLLLNRVTREA
jgi:hypothetical protein